MPAVQDALLQASLARVAALETTVEALKVEIAALKSKMDPLPLLPEPDTEAVLITRLREYGAWTSGDGRIGESDLAWLLGWNRDTLRNMRRFGNGPPAYRIGGHGHQVTYRIADIARWLDHRREI